jgi:two-component system CheB/CheR fusion protein
MVNQGDKPEDHKPMDQKAGTDDKSASAERPLTVVGIGASAGGLEALASMIKELELDNTAFVVVQHLSPDHESMLGELLSRSTSMKVVTITDGMALEANRIHVIPPNTDLALLHGVLHLMPPMNGRGPRLAVDFFLRSLAADRGERAIGVILSGAGTDGTFGLEAIKAEGGITFVQDPATARYDGMPRSALDSGCADFCLAPDAIGRELVRLSRHPYLARDASASASATALAPVQHLGKIFILIRKEFDNDLTHYKHTTIERRIERRMALHKIDKLGDYVKYLQSNRSELVILYKEILIGVTTFFRDRAPFEYLSAVVFPRLMEHKKPGDAIRIWSAGCSTGEEAYSVAICLLEFLGDRALDFKIQIFGTDIDEASIQRARRGIYPQNISLDVSLERLHRFFRKEDGEYQVSRAVRDLLVFATQNLTKDAPFSRLDLVTCRNVLIYLQPVLQKKVLRILHYALNSGGCLMLGTSETVGDSPDLFGLQDRKNKVYLRKNITALPTLDVIFSAPSDDRASVPAPPPRENRPVVSVQLLADRKLLDRYAPPGVLLNENLEILQFRGRTGPYLEPSPGVASLHIFKHVRPELQADLRSAIQQARVAGVPVTSEAVLRERGGSATRRITIEVIPLHEGSGGNNCLLVTFRDDLESPRPSPPAEAEAPAGVQSPAELKIEDVERELQATKDYLQSTIEELETANEELQSSNEELQSSNEELQSTNEELETSKEELQSTNEELTTVNDELQNRMSELNQSRDDLDNLLQGIDSAAVIVGTDMRMRRFGRTAEKLLHLAPTDVGRPIAHLSGVVKNTDLEADVQESISHARAVQRDVVISQRWYVMRAEPYLTSDRAIRGTLLLFAEIPPKTHTLDQALAAAEYASTLLVTIKHALLILDEKMQVVWANAAFYQTFDVTPADTTGNLMQRLGNSQWAHPQLVELVRTTLASGLPFKGFEIVYEMPRGQRRMSVGGSIIPGPPPRSEQRLILIVIEEVSAPPPGPDSKVERS